MSLNRMIGVYRKTIKKVPGVHPLLYAVGERMVIPLLEKALRFQTPPDDPLNFRLKLLLRQWEPETVAFFRKVIRRGDYVLDIGAHVGYYTRLFAKLVGPSGLVAAIEPHPENFRLLKLNTQGLINVTVMNVAAANQEGIVDFYDAIDSSTGAILKAHEIKREFVLATTTPTDVNKRIREKLPVRTYNVTAVSLDMAFPDKSFRIAKIDVEGAECLAIQGMSRILEELEILVFELAPGNLINFGYQPEDLIGLIEKAGLGYFYYIDGALLERIGSAKLQTLASSLGIDKFVNVVATRYPLNTEG